MRHLAFGDYYKCSTNWGAVYQYSTRAGSDNRRRKRLDRLLRSASKRAWREYSARIDAFHELKKLADDFDVFVGEARAASVHQRLASEAGGRLRHALDEGLQRSIVSLELLAGVVACEDECNRSRKRMRDAIARANSVKKAWWQRFRRIGEAQNPGPPKRAKQIVRTLEGVQEKLAEHAKENAEAAHIHSSAGVLLNGKQDALRRLCSKWKGVKATAGGVRRSDSALFEDLKKAVLKAASEFLSSHADLQHNVSGVASGSTEGPQCLATCSLATDGPQRDDAADPAAALGKSSNGSFTPLTQFRHGSRQLHFEY